MIKRKVKGELTNTQSLNRYAYVEGNPVNFLDPFGLEKVELYTGVLHMFATILFGVGSFVKPFEVKASTITPAFDKIGLGTQYQSPVSAEILLKHGIIKRVGDGL